jgi:hypothetical protein
VCLVSLKMHCTLASTWRVLLLHEMLAALHGLTSFLVHWVPGRPVDHLITVANDVSEMSLAWVALCSRVQRIA